MSLLRFKSLIATCATTLLALAATIVLTQDIQVYPGAWNALISSTDDSYYEPPPGVESTFIETADGERLEVWRVEPAQPIDALGIVLHGNGGSLRAHFSLQKWLSEVGVTNYAVDYRGFGRSTGWPSEPGIYEDSRTTLSYARLNEATPARDLVIVGSSLGTGPAAKLALDSGAAALVLISPYTSLVDVVRENTSFSLLAPFLWSKFPAADFVRDLQDTCLVVAHGKRDSVIPFSQGETVVRRFGGRRSVFIADDQGDHNDTFHRMRHELSAALMSCLSNVDERR